MTIRWHAILTYTVIAIMWLITFVVLALIVSMFLHYIQYLVTNGLILTAKTILATIALIGCVFILFKMLSFIFKLTRNFVFLLKNPHNKLDALFDGLL